MIGRELFFPGRICRDPVDRRLDGSYRTIHVRVGGREHYVARTRAGIARHRKDRSRLPAFIAGSCRTGYHGQPISLRPLGRKQVKAEAGKKLTMELDTDGKPVKK